MLEQLVVSNWLDVERGSWCCPTDDVVQSTDDVILPGGRLLVIDDADVALVDGLVR